MWSIYPWTKFLSMHTSEEFQVSLTQSVSQGERLEPNEDILLKALKAPEHPGCVRAIGYGVCKSDYLPRLPGKKEAKVDKSKFEAMKKELIYLWGKVENNDQSIKKLTKENMGEPSRSCSPIILEGVTPCDLYSDNPSYHLVGRGSVYNQLGDIVHNRPLPAEHVRVGVEIVFEGNAPLHVPNEDAGLIILDDALGAHVAWPIGLIDLKITHSTQSKDNEKDTRNTKESVASRKESDVQKLVNLIGFSKNNIPYCKFLLCYVKEGYTIGHQWDVPMPMEIFNYEYTEMLSHAKISENVHHEWLGSSTICLYIRFDKYSPEQIEEVKQEWCRYIFDNFICK